MNKVRKAVIAALVLAPAVAAQGAAPIPTNELVFSELWRAWASGTAGSSLDGGAEIGAFDAASGRVFVTNGGLGRLDYFDANTSGDITSISSIALGGGPNSVAVRNGIVAVAVEAANKQDNGFVEFYDTDGNFLNAVTAGALPDMVTFTPDGNRVLVANEGEPNDDFDNDPVGSISIIDISGGVAGATVTTAGFGAFSAADMNNAGVRIFGPGAGVAQDLEPEYIAVSPDGATAFVTLQENNAVAVVDIASATVTAIRGLGTKDFIDPANQIDASNRDGVEGNFQNWPVKGMFQPDTIASYEAGGETYFVTANEGDARDYDGFSEETRIGDEAIDPALDALLTASLGTDWQADENLGRLRTTTTADTDGDGDLDELLAFGARSFSIWDGDGNLVWDSADALENITLADGTFAENRSDDKGPEPEGLTIGILNGKTYAFVGLERTNGVVVYNITDPNAPQFVSHLFNGFDVSPEGLAFVAAGDSPTGNPLLIVTNEVSGTTTAYSVSAVPLPAAVWLMGPALLGLLSVARRRT
ncbi:MAG: choice-of-anchor I family protein [Gammaproteobacteria bacterium]|nr:choice-of-anchor I family protein [Gammaproteobacteria bacterium]